MLYKGEVGLTGLNIWSGFHIFRLVNNGPKNPKHPIFHNGPNIPIFPQILHNNKHSTNIALNTPITELQYKPKAIKQSKLINNILYNTRIILIFIIC